MKIAIIGSGISGLSTAYFLNKNHDITLYEKNDYLGGHTRTLTVDYDGVKIPVDTGFIVFNYRNYPLLTKLFDELKVAVFKSDMSFSVKIDDGWLEYGTQTLSSLFAQKRNLIRPNFYRMIKDILSFNKKSLTYLEKKESPSLAQCMDELKMGDWFRNYYLLAVGGSIWSAPFKEMMSFPAKTFIRFFQNHGLLTVNDQPQWYTVKNGAKEYVKKLTAHFSDKIKLNTEVKNVQRVSKKVVIKDSNGNQEIYDQVVFASHADETLKMLKDVSAEEKEILSSFRYQKNKVILHRDENFMPKRKKCWASWVYLLNGRKDANSSISLTYWMNRLQNIDNSYPLFVTLNPEHLPEKDKIFNEHIFEHPIFDQKAIKAQEAIKSIQGNGGAWYAGAYQRYGFHEDGILSATNVVEKINGKK